MPGVVLNTGNTTVIMSDLKRIKVKTAFWALGLVKLFSYVESVLNGIYELGHLVENVLLNLTNSNFLLL